MARQASPIFKPDLCLIRTFGFLYYIAAFICNVTQIKNTACDKRVAVFQQIQKSHLVYWPGQSR